MLTRWRASDCQTHLNVSEEILLLLIRVTTTCIHRVWSVPDGEGRRPRQICSHQNSHQMPRVCVQWRLRKEWRQTVERGRNSGKIPILQPTHRMPAYHYAVSLLVLLRTSFMRESDSGNLSAHCTPSLMWHDPPFAFIHVLVFYTLAFLTFSSLLVCVTRDPGSTKGSLHSQLNGERYDVAGSDEELSRLVIADGESEQAEMSLAEVLASAPYRNQDGAGSVSFMSRPSPIQALKPKRDHHCSTCGRYTLKMGQQFQAGLMAPTLLILI